MCGIVGYCGQGNAVKYIIDGLFSLEYRGYDSAGLAFFDKEGKIEIRKKKGRVKEVASLCEGVVSSCAIGHTRWATHGKPDDINAHPHACGDIVLVHNGIIENCEKIKGILPPNTTFVSSTDSEVVAHLINHFYKGDLLQAVQRAACLLEGSFAIAAMCVASKTLVAARKNAPIVVARSNEGSFVASDQMAVSNNANSVYFLEDNCFALLCGTKIDFFDKNLNKIELSERTVDVVQRADKGAFSTFMEKEIYEIPSTIEATKNNFFEDKHKHNALKAFFEKTDNVRIVACGTAFHSALVGKIAIEQLAGVPVQVDIASEFRYMRPVLPKNTLLIAISQSGETADTLQAAGLARQMGIPVVALTNEPTSTISRPYYSNLVFSTLAGKEIGVAATKSYNGQLTLLYLFALTLAQIKRKKDCYHYFNALDNLPNLAKQTLLCADNVKTLAENIEKNKGVFFVGRGYDYAVAQEGSLKLKEISYIHSEGYAAGELKHGTIALIERETPVFVLLNDQRLLKKTLNAAHEVKARGAKVVAVTCFEEICGDLSVDHIIKIPHTLPLFMPLLSVIPLQMFAFYCAVCKGLDPDKPRNLAKSVTVE